jgi:hypothetical protein
VKQILVDKLGATFDSNLGENATKFDYSTEFSRIAALVPCQSFKNMDELIHKFQEAVQQQKNRQDT